MSLNTQERSIQLQTIPFSDIQVLMQPVFPKMPTYSVSKDLLAAASANMLFVQDEFQIFYKKKLWPRRKELIENVLKSKYPYAFPFTFDNNAIIEFLCFYGILLSNDPQDQKMIIKQIDKTYKFGLIEILDEDLVPLFRLDNLPSGRDVFCCVVTALTNLLAGNPLHGGDSFQEKRSIFFCLHYCLSGLFGVDLNEIKIDGSPTDKFPEKALRLYKKPHRIINMESICGLFFCCNGITSPQNCIKGLPLSVISEEEFNKKFLHFINLISDDDSETPGFLKKILFNDCRTFCTITVSVLLKLREETIRQVLADESEEEKDKGNEKVEIVFEPNPLAEALSENASLKQKIAALQEERYSLSQKINDLRSDLSKVSLDNKYYKEQLDAIQAAEKNLPDEDDDTAFEPLSDDDMNLLRDMRVVILGGHDRMHQHMSQDHMGWTYVKPKEKVAKNVFDSADLIVIVSKYIAHSSYFCLRSYAEKNPSIQKKIIHTPYKNKDRIYRQIFDWLAA